jgi:hypothetical protein
LTRKKGVQAQFAAVGAFLFLEGKDRAQESYARYQTPSPGQGAPAAPDAASRHAAASPDHRGGPARGRAARGAPAPVVRAAGYHSPRRGDVDWDYEQYQQALAQLEAEGVIRSTSEMVG